MESACSITHLTAAQAHDVSDAAEGIYVALSEERDSFTASASAACSAYAMYVRNSALRKVVVDHHVDILQWQQHARNTSINEGLMEPYRAETRAWQP